ncbi:MAG: lipoprotein [Gammaproteobacteria bacterium]|nr:lipoprotein [Gammaproteobacteria bacterium]
MFFIVLAAMLVISGCGNKGPLTLPVDKTSQPEN